MHEYIQIFFDWCKNQSSGITAGVVVGLVVYWICDKFRRHKDSKENFFLILRKAIQELNFNATPCVGGPEVNFRTDSLLKLLALKKLKSVLQKEVQEYVHDAGICNGRGGYSPPGKKPGHIQGRSKILAEKLEKIELGV